MKSTKKVDEEVAGRNRGRRFDRTREGDGPAVGAG